MTEKLSEKFVSDDGYSTVSDPVDGAGGKIGNKLADVKKSVDPTADSVDGAKKAITPSKAARETVLAKEETETEVREEILVIDEAVSSLFEGENLSEDFKKKAAIVFSAAVNEAVSTRLSEEVEALKEQFEEKLSESISESLEEIVESLDGYLDYVISEWMEENKLAVDAGIKVEMAESLLGGLKGLFYEHNISIDEETIDVVASLESELAETLKETNEKINENLALMKENAALRAEKVFMEMTEDLTVSQRERLRVLSEKISFEDLDSYENDLSVLKESFFKTESSKKQLIESVSSEEENPIITEETKSTKPVSEYSTINAYVRDLGSIV